MSLLDEMATNAMNNVAGDATNPLASGIVEMIHNHPGGLSGLVESFKQKGFGEIVNSWVSTGQNMPISGEQIRNVLGGGVVNQLASRVGISQDSASSSLAQILPMIADKLTPNGQVPQQGSVLETGMNILRSFNRTETDAWVPPQLASRSLCSSSLGGVRHAKSYSLGATIPNQLPLAAPSMLPTHSCQSDILEEKSESETWGSRQRPLVLAPQ